MGNKSIDNFTFHENKTGIGTGKEYIMLGTEDYVYVDIDNTAAVTVVFEVKGISGDWEKISGVNIATLDMADTTSLTTSQWEINLSGMVGFRVNLTANVGTVSIYGKVIGE